MPTTTANDTTYFIYSWHYDEADRATFGTLAHPNAFPEDAALALAEELLLNGHIVSLMENKNG